MNWINLSLRIFTITMIGFFAIFVSKEKLMLSFIPLTFSVLGLKNIKESSLFIVKEKLQ